MQSKSSQYIGRYAPSPTGRLHLGNLRTALLAWLHARLHGGELLLRFDDLDTPRVVQGSAEQIIDDLQWLGLDWDGDIYYQSAHLASYEKALSQLESYPCFCSRKDIQQAVSAPHGQFSVYPGTCRDLSIVEKNQKTKEPAIRYKVASETISFEDILLGKQQEYLPESSGDFVVKRADGLFAYQLAVVVDDIAQGVTHVVRGADLLDSTTRQIVLFNEFESAAPQYMHVPLLLNEEGQRMAKRDGSQSIEQWQDSGRNAQQLLAYLASSAGINDDVDECTLEELLASLSLPEFEKRLAV